jgi:hypothetical protein
VAVEGATGDASRLHERIHAGSGKAGFLNLTAAGLEQFLALFLFVAWLISHVCLVRHVA